MCWGCDCDLASCLGSKSVLNWVSQLSKPTTEHRDRVAGCFLLSGHQHQASGPRSRWFVFMFLVLVLGSGSGSGSGFWFWFWFVGCVLRQWQPVANSQ
jgi:hypothetical protein